MPIKIILSRKGFDSQYGGVASPIFPDGKLLPLPIPSDYDDGTFDQVLAPGLDVGKIVSDLTRGRHSPHSRAHHDPDLARAATGCSHDWRPAFGQCGSALRHLQLSDVKPRDVFLFFGWFRRVEQSNGTWHYVKGSPNLHLIFGWLEVGEFIDLAIARDKLIQRAPWTAAHPHLKHPYYNNIRGGNGLYIASEKSRYAPQSKFGGGRFPLYSPALQLTDDASPIRSVWSLPGWFYPKGGRRPPALSYHESSDRWTRRDDRAIVRTVAKGQEFVFSTVGYPEAIPWVRALIRGSASTEL